jgi:hypothetical protein
MIAPCIVIFIGYIRVNYTDSLATPRSDALMVQRQGIRARGNRAEIAKITGNPEGWWRESGT